MVSGMSADKIKRLQIALMKVSNHISPYLASEIADILFEGPDLPPNTPPRGREPTGGSKSGAN